MDRHIGNFEAGKEADFVVLDACDNPLLARRLASSSTLAEELFAMMVLGDQHCTAATYVLGRCAYRRAER